MTNTDEAVEGKTHYRSIFISDLHLGSTSANAEAVDDFLKHSTSDYLYLVGDIIDCWALRRGSSLPPSHVKVLRRLLKRSEQDVDIKYILGNHDEVVRQFLPLTIGNIEVCDEAVHTLLDGRKLIVFHGDMFDSVIHKWPLLAWIGDIGYTNLLRVHRAYSFVRKLLGFKSKWSLAAACKGAVKEAVKLVSDYQIEVLRYVRKKNADGAVCGHIHTAELIEDLDREMTYTYANCGDWVESCTALVEHTNGVLEIIYYPLEKKYPQEVLSDDSYRQIELAMLNNKNLI